ncbi:MAG: AsmA family protein [Alphaproteobacteria bacterium ADurb.Bin438]|nr:MAG: AsmA family protein [Alphaproteobacteria bacterium ADurb.Bin438]
MKPALRIDGAKLSNASWSTSNPYMVEVASLDAEFSLLPLLQKEIIVEKVVIRSPKIHLEENSKGQVNWGLPMKKANKKPEENGKKLTEIEKSKKDGFDLNVKNFEINNAMISYNGSIYKIDHLALSASSDEVLVDFNSVLKDIPISLKGKFGGINALIKNKKNFPVDFEAKIALVNLKISGIIEDLKALNGLKLNTVIVADDLVNSLKILKLDVAKSLPLLKIDTFISGNLSNISLNNLKVNFGKNIIDGNVNYIPQNLKADLKFNTIDLSEVVLNGDNENENGNIPVATKPKNNKIFSKNKIDLSSLNLLKFDIKILIDGFENNFVNNLNNIKITAINNKELTAKMEANVEQGKIVGDVIINKNYDIVTKFDVESDDLSKTYKDETKKIESGKLSLKGNFKTKGENVADIMGNLDGNLLLQAENANVNFEIPSIEGSVINTILRGSKKDMVSCFVTNLDFKDGVASLNRRIGVETSKINMTFEGNVDFKKEYLKLVAKPMSKKLVGQTTDFISSVAKLEGPLSNPKVVVSPLSVVSLGTALIDKVSAVASKTGVDLTTYDKNPCKTALNKGVMEKVEAPKSNNPKTNGVNGGNTVAPQDLLKDLEDTGRNIRDELKDIHKNLKGLFK